MNNRGELIVPVDRATVAYLGLGANLGDRESTLWKAIEMIGGEKGISISAVSPIYETEPWGNENQPKFLNLVVQIETMLEPDELLDRCLNIENALGRVRREHWGARTIYIDILSMAGIESDGEKLVLPHPYLTERAFMLMPLFDVAPDLMIRRRPVWQWLKEVDGKDGVRRI